jgi:hypothetical protein
MSPALTLAHRSAPSRAACAALLAVLTLGACAAAQQPRAQATAAQKAACRQRADEVYEKQNRGDVYRADNFAGGLRDTPYASQGMPVSPSAGLSARFARDTLFDDCLRNASGDVPDVSGEPTGTGSPALGGASGAPGSGLWHGTALRSLPGLSPPP